MRYGRTPVTLRVHFADLLDKMLACRPVGKWACHSWDMHMASSSHEALDPDKRLTADDVARSLASTRNWRSFGVGAEAPLHRGPQGLERGRQPRLERWSLTRTKPL